MEVVRPIRLVYKDEEGVFRMDSETASILEQRLKGPIGLISVCGPIQQGKSFLANQLLGRTSGFKVASVFPGPLTKGLWLWSANSPSSSRKTGADGTEYDILVMDTQGTDGYAEDEDYMYLAVVLSSVLIYNQVGVIKDCLFHGVSLVTKLANRDTTATASSPTFVWVLRDFFMYRCFLGRTPTEYMESFLEPVADYEDVSAVNKVRESVKAVFPDRHCAPLVRPMFEESDLRVLGQLPMEEMRPEFKKGMDELRSLVFEKTEPKKIGGSTVMTGPILVQLTQYILDAFNSGKRPTMASIFKNVEKNVRQKALKSAITCPAANARPRKRRA